MLLFNELQASQYAQRSLVSLLINALELLYLVKFEMSPLLLVVLKKSAIVLNIIETCCFASEKKKIGWKKICS